MKEGKPQIQNKWKCKYSWCVCQILLMYLYLWRPFVPPAANGGSSLGEVAEEYLLLYQAPDLGTRNASIHFLNKGRAKQINSTNKTYINGNVFGISTNVNLDGKSCIFQKFMPELIQQIIVYANYGQVAKLQIKPK